MFGYWENCWRKILSLWHFGIYLLKGLMGLLILEIRVIYVCWIDWWDCLVFVVVVDTKFGPDFFDWILWGARIRIICIFNIQWVESACEVSSECFYFIFLVVLWLWNALTMLECWITNEHWLKWHSLLSKGWVEDQVMDSTRCVYILMWFLVDSVESRYLKEDKPHGSAGGLYYFRDMIMEDCPVWTLILFIILFCVQVWEIKLCSVTF